MNLKCARLAAVLGLLSAACGTESSASDPAQAGGAPGSGGIGPSSGNGGAGGIAPSGGAPLASGGAPSSSGGTSSTSGGTMFGGMGGTLSGTGGAGTGGATPISAGGVGATGGAPPSSGGAAGAAGTSGASTDICTRWKTDRANLSEGTWTGNVASCDPGDLPADARANALRVLNLYRFIAGLPPVVDDPAMNAKDQKCALMMRANNMLSHSPPMTWTCWTRDGADAANGSNIGTAPAVASMDGYMLDPGNPTTIGHRRWVLSNSLGPIGIGGTDRSSCVMTLGGTGHAGKAWAAWPAPGSVPYQALAATRQGTVDTTGWTIQSDTVNLSAAQVTVMSDGAPLAVTVTQLGTGYGSRYAFRFNPQGWTTQAGKKYAVSVSGVTPAIAYEVDVVDCK